MIWVAFYIYILIKPIIYFKNSIIAVPYCCSPSWTQASYSIFALNCLHIDTASAIPHYIANTETGSNHHGREKDAPSAKHAPYTAGSDLPPKCAPSFREIPTELTQSFLAIFVHHDPFPPSPPSFACTPIYCDFYVRILCDAVALLGKDRLGHVFLILQTIDTASHPFILSLHAFLYLICLFLVIFQ